MSDLDELVKKWSLEQNELSKLVITKDEFNDIQFVGGLDISFMKDNNNACVTLVVLSYPDLKIKYQISKQVIMNKPYISGFLGFREVEHFINLLQDMDPKFKPQILFVDGNGIFHPRKFGSASHIGLLLGIPTIGVSKNLLYVEQIDTNYIAGHITSIKGSSFNLVGESGFTYGACVMTSNSSKHPLYVSIGHKISLETATKLTLECAIHKIPEPIRQADLISREYIRNLTKKIDL